MLLHKAYVNYTLASSVKRRIAGPKGISVTSGRTFTTLHTQTHKVRKKGPLSYCEPTQKEPVPSKENDL